MNIRMTKTCSALMLALLAASCAGDGFDDKEKFSAGVSNVQLESPEISPECFSTLTNPDGTESVKFSWPLVMGAGGYLCNVKVVDDPANPEYLVADSVVDGTTLTFIRREDTNYEVSVKTLGNEKYNNTEASNASVYAYSTMLPAVRIPAGAELSQWVAENLVPGDEEIGFELEAGATYKLEGTLDFGLNKVTFRGNKAHRPIVEVGENGTITTQAGLKVKFINFDCTNSKQKGLLTLSDQPNDILLNKNYPTVYVNAGNNCYIIEDPVMFQSVNVKNLPKGLLYGNETPWALTDFRVDDCIFQLNNASSDGFINLHEGSAGLLKNMVLSNSTFYNLAENESAYFIRYANASNAQPKKVYGEALNASNHRISHCTFVRTFTAKDFGNQILNNAVFSQTVDHCIFYDVFRIYQYLQNNNKKTTEYNTMHYVVTEPQSNDTGGRKDSQGNPLSTLDDPQFAGQFMQELDLTKENGGINLRPTSSYTVDNKIGDLRWFEMQ